MRLIIIGITCSAVLGHFIPATRSAPVGSSFGSLVSVSRSTNERRAEFGESIRDWFQNLRNRFFGNSDDSQAIPPTDAAEIMKQLEEKDSKDRQRSPGAFFLDLSNLEFDPRTDWGIRLGQWYLIKKSYPTNTEDWNAPESAYPEWPASGEGSDSNTVHPLVTPSLNEDESLPETLSSEKKQDDTSKTRLPETKDTENTTKRLMEYDRSTEVILPSE